MTIIFEKNTLEALDVPFVELYMLRYTNSNTLLLSEVDEYLLDSRPDWVVHRLIRERPPQSVLKLPAGYEGGKCLLLDNLRKAAESPGSSIEWTVFGFVAFWMLRLKEKEDRSWYVRMPQRLSKEPIPDNDRINRKDLESILSWMKIRQGEFEKTISISTKISLKSRHEKKLSQGNIINIEKLILLALGKIAIFFVSLILKKVDFKNQDDEDVRETFSSILNYLSAANGGWRPGEVIFLTGLKHHRNKFKDNIFYSCYLPFTAFDYCDLLAAATGTFAKITNGLLDNRVRMFIGLTSIQHREWLFFKAQRSNKDKSDAAGRLIVTIDRIFIMAINSRHIVLAGSLAARYLAIGNFLGWKGMMSIRLKHAKLMKSIAKMSGCIVQGDAEELNFSDEYAKYNKQDRIYSCNSEEYQEMLRALLKQPTDVIPSTTSALLNAGEEDDNLIKVVATLGISHDQLNAKYDLFNILRIAHTCLTPGNGKSSEDLNRLLDANHSIFNLFIEASHVGGIVLLSKHLFDKNKFDSSVLNSAQNVVKFSELLVYWLERPYMADIKARSEWQRQLWQVYLALNKQEKEKLNLDDKLLIYSAISNVTAASMKELRKTHADQLEKTIYEEWDSSNSPIRDAYARTYLRVSTDDLCNIFNNYEERGQVKTAFVQMILTPDGKDLMLLVTRKCGNTIEYREGDISFTKCRHQDYQYDSWNDLTKAAVLHSYFDNETGNLHGLNTSPLGHPSISALWQCVKQLILNVGFERMPDHLCISPDPELASIPWQLIAMKEADQPDDYPLITLVHGLRWVYMSSRESADATPQRTCNKGIYAWISSSPTPKEGTDIRGEVKEKFFRVDNNCPTLIDQDGISLSVVFGHGAIVDDEPLANVEAIENLEEWNYVRGSRICVLLSCETGAGMPGALGDFLSISHKLCRNSRAVLLPPVRVSHIATQVLSGVFHQAINESLIKDTWEIQEVYKEAIRQHPGVALFSLWGLSYEPLVRKS